MTARRVAGLVGVVVVALAAASSLVGVRPTAVHAACTEETDDPSNLFTVSPPVNNLTLGGTAPFQITITFVDTTLLTGPMTMTFSWGDGSSSPVNFVSCGVDELYNVPAQQLVHTYTTPGQYVIQWHLNSQIAGQFSSLAVIVTVTAAEPTPVPPTATPPPQPTAAAATPQPTAAAGATEAPQPTPATETPREPASPSPSTTATATRPAATAAPTATPTPAPAAPATGRIDPPAPESGRPETIRALPEITDVSTDPDVVVTNLVLAGVTIWVFFSSVLFNQTLASHRSEVSGWLSPLRKPFSRVRSLKRPLPNQRWLAPVLVLFATALIYEFMNPGVGFNEASFVLFVSVFVGVGLVGFAFSSVEAWSRERLTGVDATVRPFPLSLGVAAASVLASRLLDLQPGVIYGFAASCVVLSDVAVDARREGRTLLVPVVACLSLSVVCWLLVGPARAVPVGWLSHLLEATAVIVFIGGLEGLLVNLLPLEVMDGAKIYRWNRIVWALLLAVCAFLFWHVLLNAERSYFDSLREASSLSVLLGFLLYTSAGVGLWAFFRFRKRAPVSAAPA